MQSNQNGERYLFGSLECMYLSKETLDALSVYSSLQKSDNRNLIFKSAAKKGKFNANAHSFAVPKKPNDFRPITKLKPY